MDPRRFLSLTLVAAAVLAGCSSVPERNARLEEARSDYQAAQANPQARELASAELRQAGDALNLANESWARHDDSAQVDHLAYLAKQRVAMAQEAANRKGAQASVAEAGAMRDRMRLAARTREADAAQTSAVIAQRDAQASQRQSEASQRDAEASQRQSALSQQQANAAQQQAANAQMQAAASQQQAGDAESRNRALQAQLRDLNAKKTERGLVITIGDVLFDTDRAELKSGGMRSVDKLVGFLKEYPQRRALVEGFTDSTGSEGHNQDLSGRRADAVRSALVGGGVGGERVTTRGYGDAFPVAGNDSAGGRQMNRRVEIILSDETGNITPR
jgi:outer membrane protein OmpA-like peptidoglycan-associated protein